MAEGGGVLARVGARGVRGASPGWKCLFTNNNSTIDTKYVADNGLMGSTYGLRQFVSEAQPSVNAICTVTPLN